MELRQQLGNDLATRLNVVENKAREIWKKGELYHAYYTLHGIEHSDAVINILNLLVVGLRPEDKLEEIEIFCLLSSAYLHDVGMQCKYPEDEKEVKSKSQSENEPYTLQDLIRDEHHLRSGRYIKENYKDLGLDHVEAECVKLISEGHRKVKLDSDNYDRRAIRFKKVRIRLLASLLRLADELDIDYKRAPEILYEILKQDMPDFSKLQWLKHYYTSGIIIEPVVREGKMELSIEINWQYPREDRGHKIAKVLVLRPIQEKIIELQLIFLKYGLDLDLTHRVYLNTDLHEIPEYLYKYIFGQRLNFPIDYKEAPTTTNKKPPISIGGPFNSKSFKRIFFGMSAAENEMIVNPNLLIHGFLDEYGYIDKLIYEHKFLILGPKGSGKSAIGSKIELISQECIESNKDDKIFVTKYELENFLFSRFTTKVPGKSNKITSNQWESILLISFLKAFIDGKEVCLQQEGSKEIIEIMNNLGLSSFTELMDIVNIIRKGDFRPNLEGYGLSGLENGKSIHITAEIFFNILRDICYSVNLDNKYLIIIDNLDSIITTENEKYYQYILFLIKNIYRINTKFKAEKIDAKIIILCRLDLFDILSGLNKAKIKSDYSIILDWYQKEDDLNYINLVKILNLRAKICLNEDVKIFDTFFPKTIKYSDILRVNTARFLLSCTRYLPKDLIQLMNMIQKTIQGNSNEGEIKKEEILQGIHSYSCEYFMTEIKDELYSYYSEDPDQDIVNKIMKILGKMEVCIFRKEDIYEKIKDDPEFIHVNINKMLESLYNCNAIGNINSNTRYPTFRYNNHHICFNGKQEILVHRGLWPALNFGKE